MKYSFVFLLGMILYAGCKKDDPVIPPDPHPEITDAQTILLKDITALSLPNPYFHFEYDQQRFVKQVSFASSFFVYDVDYENGRVKKMINAPNKNMMVYSYADSKVSEINEFSGRDGSKLFTYRFTYNPNKQLNQVLWIAFAGDATGVVYKKADLVYYLDGNLASVDIYADALLAGELNWSSKKEFEDYDNKHNVDDIIVLKDFFDSFLFLPGVKLQKNNPAIERITSAESAYDISYTYEYNDSLPVKKTGLVKQTRGGSNQPVEVFTLFSYY